MKTPDIPNDEQERLQTLRSINVLDTQPEERFDRLTRMAKRIFGVPIALVSLVDENRQWFKSRAGLNATETPRDISFCGHAILGDDVFIIPNTLEDERFADNPLVVNDPEIRFYAGCPLRALNGEKLGTLCIIDQKPGNLELDDIEALKDLASMVEHELAAFQLALLDDLTSISNRRGFMMLAQQSLNICKRQNIPASLIFFDLDSFKPINDKYGHAEGDRALAAFADQMKSVCRASDIIARLGGDEFVVLLTNAAEINAEKFISKFNTALTNYNSETNRGYYISYSYGIVSYQPEVHTTIEEMLNEGDAQMYKFKESRKSSGNLLASDNR